ncbi:MAG: S-layer homology domain-containing protein [Enterocloster asparagiformis]|nr:S-layer homology domain-containing protein [Enterocloster asparagiformis]
MIFEGDSGTVYGTPTISENVEIPKGKKLEIGNSQMLTIGSGVTVIQNGDLTNEGTLVNEGILTNNGLIINKGTLTNHGTINGSGTLQSSSKVQVKFSVNGSDVSSVPYGSSFTITATAQQAQNANALSRKAAVNKVDFYLGGTNGTYLGTADVSNNTASLTVTPTGDQWKPSTNAYTITADFGGTNVGNDILLANTGMAYLTVEKASQNPPGVPGPSDQVTESSITIPTVNGQKYSCTTSDSAPSAGSGEWQDGDGSELTFDNLRQNTTYYIWTYIPEQEYYKPSPVSQGLSVTTEKSADQQAVESARALIEGVLDWKIDQAVANTESSIKTELAGRINAISSMSSTGITVEEADITIAGGFKAAIAGSAGDRNGRDGSFQFTVALSRGSGNTAGSTTTKTMGGVITATPYQSSSGSTGGSGGQNGGGGSSSSTTTTPSKKPDTPSTGEIEAVPGGVITGNTIKDAIGKASAGKNGGGNGYALTVSAPGQMISITITREALEELINSGVERFKLDFGGAVSMTFTNGSLKEIAGQTVGDVTFTAAGAAVTGGALSAIGSRPAYDLSISYQQEGQTVKLSGIGSVAISFSYPLGANEQEGALCAVYVDGGNGVWLDQSGYDGNAKALLFASGRLGTYGIGCKALPAFTDIQGHWAKSDMDFAAARGLIADGTATTFRPDEPVTRGTLITALGRLAGVNPADYPSTGRFTDVAATEEYAPYVEWAVSKGIGTVTSRQTFEPGRNVTREEMADIILRYAKAQGDILPVTREAEPFSDEREISGGLKGAVEAVWQAGIMSSRDGRRFSPGKEATRAEAAAALKRYVTVMVDPAAAEGWAQNDSGTWLYYQKGKPVTGWKQMENLWYYFDAAGLLQTGGWRQIGGKWYYFYSNGVMAADTNVDGYEVGPDGARK